MAHYAFIDSNNVVVEVITGRDEHETVNGVSDWETYYQAQRENVICKRTSYNTYRDKNGVPCHRLGGQPFRGQYAAIGDLWDGSEFHTTPIKAINDE